MTPNNEQVRFNRNADAKRFGNRLSNPWIREKESRLAAFVAQQAGSGPGRFLEVGCGEGSNLTYIHEALPEHELFAVDFSIGKINFARGHVSEASFVCGDALSLAFDNAMFDVVFCRDLLHHVDFARRKVLEEALRVCKPGGRVIVLESNGRKLLSRLAQLLLPAERGVSNSTPEKLRALAADCEWRSSLIPLECSMLVRAVGFFLGWPETPLGFLLRQFYLPALLWERAMELVVPRHNWSYMALVLEK